MAKSINQQLIADKLNISRTTVSRCFTNHPGINPETRGRVFKLAAALGYQHLEARTGNRLRQAKPKTFGVLICTKVDEYLNTDYQSPGEKLIAGLSEYAQTHQVNLETHFVDPGDTRLSDSSYANVDAIAQRAWDGVVLVYPFPSSVVDELSLLMPVVSLVEQYSDTAVDCVDVDHHRGIAAIIKHLVELGHQRIGFLSLDYGVDANWALRRHSAYVEEITRNQLTVDPANVLNIHPQGRMTPEATYARALQRTRYGVTAWVCAADHQAYGLISFFKENGVGVPNEVSITGFDGIDRPKRAPKLTTIEIPYYEIGQIGGRRLAELARKRFGSVQHILLDCVLQTGKTSRVAADG